MKAVIHIGQSKAGSTSLQKFLQINSQALAAEGVHYNRNPEGNSSNVELLLAAFLHSETQLKKGATRQQVQPYRPVQVPEKVAACEQALTELVATHPDGTFVASCEQLFLWLSSPEQVQALDDFLHRYFSDVQYYCYLRRQEDWIASRYAQYLRSGGTFKLNRYVQNQLETVSIEKDLERWETVVGRGNLHVRLLESDYLLDRDLATDFLSCIGLENTGYQSPSSLNESFTPPVAEFARLVNLSNKSEPSKDHETTRRQMMKVLTQLSQGQSKLRLSAEQTATVRSSYEASNERIRARYFPERAELFPPKPTSTDTSDPSVSRREMGDIALHATSLLMSGNRNRKAKASPS
ncbi:MAG: hypothetical protein GJ676_20985 [Rhodobacteraceae bacterium]|nr:hypothetical protein [Paracoccaceae bacterium]